MRLYIGLVHYPVYNKNREKIASAITTLDIHDLARLAKTYDARRFFVITPLRDQQVLAKRILSHWLDGHGGRYNRYRKEAIECVSVMESIEAVAAWIQEMDGELPVMIATDAAYQGEERVISFEEARRLIERDRVTVLIFGTAWGLHKEALHLCDRVLAPITGRKDYNHLSVRAAAAVILDRLAGLWPH